MAAMPDPGSASPTLQALIDELKTQLNRLPSCSPDEIGIMTEALGERLEAFAGGLHANEQARPADLRMAQNLLSDYAGLLSRAMSRVERGLDALGLSEPVYQDSLSTRPPGAILRRPNRASITA